MASSSHRTAVHGVLVEIDGLGVLIVGESGTGKSECALELVSGGHRLIADDVVEVWRTGDTLFGCGPERFFGLLEIRGLGVLDVQALFGQSAVGRDHEISFCVEFSEAGVGDRPERLGANAAVFELLGVELPRFVLQQDGRRNLRLLLEAAVRIASLGGADTEAALIAAHDELVSASSTSGKA